MLHDNDFLVSKGYWVSAIPLCMNNAKIIFIRKWGTGTSLLGTSGLGVGSQKIDIAFNTNQYMKSSFLGSPFLMI